MVLALVAVATLWAALCALADEAPLVSRALGDPPVSPGQPVPLARALHVARLALLAIAGGAGAFAVQWWYRAPGDGVGIMALGVGLLYLMGDAVPRAVGGLVPGLAQRALPLARGLLWPFGPLLGIIAACDRLAHRLLRTERARAGVLGPAQRDMLRGVFSLGETTVAEVMTPRLDIVAVEASAPWGEVLERVRNGEHARVPVYRDNIDDIVGLVYAKDLLSASVVPREEWQDLMRPVGFVPDTRSLAAMLRDFQRGSSHLAVVVDEFGGTAGIITLEDVLEEVVGEIHDEYDTEEPPAIAQDGEGRFWVDGRVPLDDLAEALGASLERDDVKTVAGLVYAELGRVPRPGEELRVDGYRVVVEQVARRRIRRVYFERIESANGGDR
jgi:Mg2+/Co2+ transporter CorC